MMDRFRTLHYLAYAACLVSFLIQIWHLAQLPSQWIKIAAVIACSAIICRAFAKRDWDFCPRGLTKCEQLVTVIYALFFAVDIWVKQYHLAFASSVILVGILLHAEVPVELWRRLRPFGTLLLLAALPTANQWSWFDQQYHELVFKSASAMLDTVGIFHVVESDRLDGFENTVQWTDLAESVWSCSALITLASLGIVWKQLRLVHACGIIPMTLAIGVAMISTRFALGVGLKLSDQLSTFLLVTFIAALYLVWAAQGIIRFAFDPIRGKYQSPWTTFWNKRTIVDGSYYRFRNLCKGIEVPNSNTDTLTAEQGELIRSTQPKSRNSKRSGWFPKQWKSGSLSINNLFIFVNGWCMTRRIRRLIPLILIVFLVPIVISEWERFPLYSRSVDRVNDRYVARLKFASSQGESGELDILTRRLEKMPNMTDEASFALAQAFFVLNQTLQSDEIIDRLVSKEPYAYAPAQLWQAKKMLSGADALSANKRIKIKSNLRASAKDLFLADESNWLLAQIHIIENNERLATTLLQSIARPQPEVLLLLARLYKNGGDQTAFMRSAKAAESACGLVISQNPNGPSKERLTLVKAILLQDRYADALGVLESIPDFSLDAEMCRIATEIDIAWIKSIPNQLITEKIKRLQHATHLDCNLPELQELIAAIVVDSAVGDQNDLILFCMDYIKASEKGGKLSANSISMLGIKAAEGKKYKLAEKLFRRAVAAGNPTPILLNNLAWVLVKQSDPELIDDALIISNQAVEAGPSEAEIWKTRAEIWLKRGHTLDAISDLEHAIKCGDINIEVTMQLATLYDEIGQSLLADKYSERAKRLRQ